MRWFRGMMVGAALALATATGALAWDSAALLLDAPVGDAKPVSTDGTVSWTTGTDAAGKATLIGSATFPTRSLGVKLTMAANPDKSVPASHLFDITFQVGDQFGGKAIANISAIAFKNNQMGAGTPLVGAAVRIADNSFLYALSDVETDMTSNMALLGDRSFMDIGIVDDGGRQSVLTFGLGDARAAFAEFAAAGLKK